MKDKGVEPERSKKMKRVKIRIADLPLATQQRLALQDSPLFYSMILKSAVRIYMRKHHLGVHQVEVIK